MAGIVTTVTKANQGDREAALEADRLSYEAQRAEEQAKNPALALSLIHI